MPRDGDSRGGWVESTIVALLVLAGAPSLSLASASEDLEEPAPWRVEHAVNASVVDNYATVNVTVEVQNLAAGAEFPFEVEVPEEAYITGLAITRNDTTYEAEVEPASAARERYEAARHQGRTAGIVEEDRGASTYRYDLNVAPNETVRATLTYEVYLLAHEGTYELPLQAPATQHGVDEGATFRVDLQHARGIEHLDTEPHAPLTSTEEGYRVSYDTGHRGPGNASSLDVAYETQGTDPGGQLMATVENGTGYFVHRFQARAAQERVPVDLALVLDRSGSMSGAKIDQLRAATRQVVDHLDERDRVFASSFAEGSRSAWEGLRALDNETAVKLNRTLERLVASGSTNIEDAIREGFSTVGNDTEPDERLEAVAFLTDGKATTGLQDNQRLRELALEENRADAHVFGLAFGSGADWGLVHGLAQDSEGYAERVPAGQGAQLDLERFLTRLTSPVLTNVTVDYEGASVQSWRVGAPVVFSGSELVYVGTFDPNRTSLNATVSAFGGSEAIHANVSAAVEDEGPDYLPRLVGYHRVRALEDRIDAEGGNETLEREATELALRHGFVTERTSLAVDLPRQQAGVDDDSDTVGDADAHDAGAREASHDAAQDRAPADADGDGISSDADACPNRPGLAANDGCPAEHASDPDPHDRDQSQTSQPAGEGAESADDEPEQTPGVGATALLAALGLGARVVRD